MSEDEVCLLFCWSISCSSISPPAPRFPLTGSLFRWNRSLSLFLSLLFNCDFCLYRLRKFTFTFQPMFFLPISLFSYTYALLHGWNRSLSLLFNCDFWLTNPKTSVSYFNQNAPFSFPWVLIFDFLFSGEIDPSILSKCDLCFTDPCQNGASCRSLPNRDFECRSVETFYRLEPFYKRTYPAAPYPSCSCASGARRDSTGRRAPRWSTPAMATRASTGPTAKCSRREDSCEWIPRPCHKVCQWEVLVGAKCGQRRARVSQVPLLRHRHPFSSPLSLYSLTSPYLYLYLCVIFQPSALAASIFSLFTHSLHLVFMLLLCVSPFLSWYSQYVSIFTQAHQLTTYGMTWGFPVMVCLCHVFSLKTVHDLIFAFDHYLIQTMRTPQNKCPYALLCVHHSL